MAATAKFSDLKFEAHPNWPGKRALMFFPNGYGVSVIQSPYSYGGKDGKYELAVMAGDAADYALTYETPVTSDVEGYLSPAAVTAIMAQVAALPAHVPA